MFKHKCKIKYQVKMFTKIYDANYQEHDATFEFIYIGPSRIHRKSCANILTNNNMSNSEKCNLVSHVKIYTHFPYHIHKYVHKMNE